jgi:dipeptidase
MKMKLRKYILVALVLMSLLVGSDFGVNECYVGKELGCTSMLVGKNATVDGSVLTSYSCDGAIFCSVNFIPGGMHEEGETIPIYTWGGKKIGEVPQVEETYSCWTPLDGALFSGGINEHQVSVGETTTGGRRELVCENASLNYPNLILLGLQRAKTARESIRIMGDLIEEYGFYGVGECITIADPDEAWAFECFGPGFQWTFESEKPGAVWAAQRIPDDEFFVSANRARIGEIDLNNSEYFMASPNVFSLAEERGWYNNSGGDGPFVFYEAYAPDIDIRCSRREWRGLSLVAPSLNLDPDLERFPFSVKPDKKLAVQDIMAIHRDTYEGTQFDITENPAFYVTDENGNKVKSPMATPYGTRSSTESELWDLLGIKSERSVSVSMAGFSFVNQLRGWLPDDIGGIMWYANDCPGTSCYVPIYAGATSISEEWTRCNPKRVDRGSAWWAFNLVNNLAFQSKYQLAIKDIRAVRDPLEMDIFLHQHAIESAALSLYKKDPAAAQEFLTRYTTSIADKVLDAYWDLSDLLLYKYYKN